MSLNLYMIPCEVTYHFYCYKHVNVSLRDVQFVRLMALRYILLRGMICNLLLQYKMLLLHWANSTTYCHLLVAFVCVICLLLANTIYQTLDICVPNTPVWFSSLKYYWQSNSQICQLSNNHMLKCVPLIKRSCSLCLTKFCVLHWIGHTSPQPCTVLTYYHLQLVEQVITQLYWTYIVKRWASVLDDLNR